MIRVVLDANIYISALEFGGTIDRFLDLPQTAGFQVFFSASIRHEVETTLLKKFSWRPRQIARLFSTVWFFAAEVEAAAIPPICRDPKDDHVLGTCLAGMADVLVTGDKDLLDLRQYGNTMIITPSEFLDEMLNLKQ